VSRPSSWGLDGVSGLGFGGARGCLIIVDGLF